MAYDRSRQPAHVRQWQDVLNEHWPPDPGNLRRMPRHRPGIPIQVRVVWEDDGEQWVDGEAVRWDAEHVYVEIHYDLRLSGSGVWVRPADVRRRETPPTSR